jgi:hypothetical protein
MTCVDTRDKVLRLAPMVDSVHREGARIFLQVGHGGLYAMEAWHEPYATRRTGPILAASPVPWMLRPAFRGVPVHVMTETDVRSMAERTGDVAAWAREAGYDGVQLGSANAKLLDQFLSPFYNRRTDEFGGSFERRARVLAVIRAAIDERAGPDFPCTVKIPAVAPGGAGQIAAADDGETLAFLRRVGATATWVTSACTGSLLLGAAGLLRGYRAATHWAYMDLLPIVGAIPVEQRVVTDRNRITGGGVTAGLDIALTIAAQLAGRDLAERIQLGLEYDPHPPFQAGHPNVARRDLVAEVRAEMTERYDVRLEQLERLERESRRGSE